jgi:RHS repeat-associated protein
MRRILARTRAFSRIREAHKGAIPRWAHALAALLILVLVTAAGAATATNRSGHRPPRNHAYPDLRNDPTARAASRAADKRIARRTARLRTAKSRAARRRSRTAYTRLSRKQALRLARRSFDEVFERPVWHGLNPGHGQQVRRYLDDFTVELQDDEGGKNSIATSTLPLRTLNGRGERVPVDLGLEASGASFVPSAPLVPTRIAKRAPGGVTLGSAAIGVRPAGAADREGTLTSDRLFYPDVGGAASDTDLLIEPNDTGAEFMWQLRSVDSPERQSLDLDLPNGAKLRSSDIASGAAEIVHGDKLLAFVAPPSAVDADGISVPVSYEIEHDTLTARVKHQNADVHYPLLVDPVFNVMEDFYDGNWDAQSNGWWQSGYGDWNWARYSFALHISAKPWASYNVSPPGDFMGWFWQAPKNAYIYRADFAALSYRRADWGGSPAGCNSRVEHGLLKGPGAGPPGPWEGDNSAFHQDPSCDNDKPSYGLPAICVAWNCSPGSGSEQNIAYHGLRAKQATANSAFAGMHRTVLYLRDRFPPKVLSTSHSQNLTDAQDGRWLGGGVNFSSTPTATDWGLGIGRLELVNRVSGRKIPVYGPDPNPRHLWCSFSSIAHDTEPDDPVQSNQTDRGSDKGDRDHRCAAAQTNPYDPPTNNSETAVSTFDYGTDALDEGIHTYGIDAYDIVGIKDDPPTSGWTLKVDRTNPQLTAKRGSLSGESYIDPGAQTLDVDLLDVMPGGGPSSGVANVEAFYDNADDPNDAPQLIGTKPGSCSPTGCTQSPTAHFDWIYTGSPRRVRISLKITDQVGNKSEPSWTVERRPEPPHLDVRGGARLPLATGRNVELDGTDPDDGIQKFVVWIDPGDDPSDPNDDPDESSADHVKTYTCPCRSPEHEPWALPANTSPGEHQILAKVYDPSGKSDEERWDVRVVTTLLTDDRDKLGLEHWFQYDDTDAGGNSTVYVNAETGNTVWHSVPIVNPGRGLSAAVNLTYNSHDRGGVLGHALGEIPIINADRSGLGDDEISEFSYGEVGNGFSLAVSGPTRLNEPLEGVLLAQAAEEGLEPTQVAEGLVPPVAFNPLDVEIKMTDADGTRHVFTRSGNRWVAPPGVNMHLRRNKAGGTFATPIEDKWAMTRPDGVTHYFDSLGFLTATEDRNNNRLEYDYEYYDALSGDVVKTVANGSGGTVDVGLCDGVNTGAIELGEHATVHPPGLPAVNIPVYCAKRVRQVVLPAGADLAGAARAARALRIDYVPHRTLVTGKAPRFHVQFPTLIGGNAGRIQRITDVAGRTYEFSYDGDGFLRSFVEAAGDAQRRTTSLEYENYAGDPVNEVREDRQLTEIREGVAENSRKTVIRHVHPEDRAPEDVLVPRQACGVTKRNSGIIEIPRDGQSGHMCRGSRNNLEKTYDYRTNPAPGIAREFSASEVTQRSTSETDPGPRASAVTRHQLDAEGRPIGVIDPIGRITKLDWNEDENAVSAIEEAAFTNDVARIELDYDTEHRTGVITGKRTFPRYPDRNPTFTTTFDYQFSSGTQHSQVPSLAAEDADGTYVADLTSASGPRPGVGQSFTIEQREGRFTGNVTERYDRPGQQGNVATTLYDDHGQILSEDDEVPGNGITTYHEYEDTGQPRRVVDARNGTSRYTYDALGNVETVTDPRAARSGVPADAFRTTLDYDAFDRLTTEQVPKLSGTDPAGDPVPNAERFTTRSRTYDRNGNVLTSTDGTGAATTISYTPMDLPSSIVAPGGEHGSERTDYAYDDADRLIARVDPRGTPADAEAIRAGQLETCTGAAEPPVLAHTTRYCLDAAGRRLAQFRTAPHASGRSGDATTLIWSYALDARNNLTRVIDPKRNRGNPVRDAILAAEGSDEDQNGQPDVVPRATFEYDKLDRRENQYAYSTDPAPDGALPDPLRTNFRYDENGNRTRVYPPRAFEGDVDGSPDEAFRNETFFDHRNQPVAVRTPAGCTAYDRREDGLVEAVTSPRGTEGAPDNCSQGGPFAHHTTRYTYNETGDLLTRSMPFAPSQYGRDDLQFQGLQVIYDRDEVGNPEHITDARGHQFANGFYDSGELRYTERPSFFELEWGDDYETPDAGRHFTEQRSAGDLEITDGGPQLHEVEDRSRNAAGSDAVPELPDSEGAGDFGDVRPQDLGDMLPDAGETTLSYDDEGRLTGIEDADSNQHEIGYDAAGRVTRKSWPFELGRHENASHQNSIVHEYHYDLDGNLERLRNGRDLDTTFSYDGYDRRIEEATPGALRAPGNEFDDEVTELYYDENDNIEERRTPVGDLATFQYGYDSLDRLTSEMNPLTDRWQYEYDPNGNLGLARAPRFDETDDPAEAEQSETRFTYDEADRLERVRRGLGHEFDVEYAYDADGNQTCVESPGAAPAPGQDAVRRQKLTDYDGRGLPWRETTSASTDDCQTPGADARTELSEFDANGNLRRIVAGEGVGGDRLPEVPHNPTTSLADATWHATVRDYDADDQLTDVHLPWSTRAASEGDAVDDPDAPGDPEFGGDERRLTQRFVRAGDPLGRVTSIVSPHETTDETAPRTSYEYFANGWVREQSEQKSTNADGNARIETANVLYEYDETGNQTRWLTQSMLRGDDSPDDESPDGRDIRRTFNDDGTLRVRVGIRPTSDGDQTRRRHEYFYNRNRSLIRFDDRDSILYEDGHPVPDIGPPDRTTTIQRDFAERETIVDEHDAGRDTTFEYDGDGNVTRRQTDGQYVETSSGATYEGDERKTTTFTYDALDRERTMTVDPARGANRLTTTTWWPSGDMREREKSNHTVETRYFNPRGEISRKIRDPQQGDTRTQDYDYDAEGNRTEDERGTHVFDPRRQLYRWTRGARYDEGGKEGTTVTYERNDAGDVREQTDTWDPPGAAGPSHTTFTYRGERLVRTHTVVPIEGSGTPQTVDSDYSYDDFGSVVRISHEESGPGSGGEDPPDGPPTPVECPGMPDNAERKVTRYCYDEFERMVLSRGEGVDRPTRYIYDGLDRRDRRIDGENRTHDYSYIGTSEMLSRETDHRGTRKQYDYDSNGRRLGQSVQPADAEDPDYRTYAVDANGSVEGLENGDGRFGADDQDTYLYDPYGEPEDVAPQGQEDEEDAGLSPNAHDNPFRFEGFYYDSGVRTYDMRARSYRPDIKRFLSQDHFESAVGDQFLQADPLTQNRYAFAGGNPVNNVEFDGHTTEAGLSDHLADLARNWAAKNKKKKTSRPRAAPRPSGRPDGGNPAASGPPSLQQQVYDAAARQNYPRNEYANLKIRKVTYFEENGRRKRKIEFAGGSPWAQDVDASFIPLPPCKCPPDSPLRNVIPTTIAVVDTASSLSGVGGVIKLGARCLRECDNLARLARGLFGGGGDAAKTLPTDVARLAEANITNSGRTVLGHHPGYIAKARARGDSYFDIGKRWDDLSDAQREAVNRRFLDRIADRGDQVVLAQPKTKIAPGSWTAREIQYLIRERQYRWVNQWSLRPK